MNKLISREKLLTALSAVSCALTDKDDIVEQGTCFVFIDNKVCAFNNEMFCTASSPLGKIKGAIPSKPMLDLLNKLPEDELGWEIRDHKFYLIGKRREAWVNMEAEVSLPVDMVEKPEEWKPLPEEFSDAIDVVQQCAGIDESLFCLTCIHIHPKWIEAFDDAQACRWRIATGVKIPFLVRASSVKNVTGLGPTEFSETTNWVHFRNKPGTVLACRRNLDEFPDITKLLKGSHGKPMTLPKGLAEACDKAQIFAEEGTDTDFVTIELRRGKLRIRAEGIHGGYKEISNLQYTGDPMEFLITPKVLQKVVKQHTECEISPGRLRVDGGSFVYVSCLARPDAGEEEPEESEDSSEDE